MRTLITISMLLMFIMSSAVYAEPKKEREGQTVKPAQSVKQRSPAVSTSQKRHGGGGNSSRCQQPPRRDEHRHRHRGGGGITLGDVGKFLAGVIVGVAVASPSYPSYQPPMYGGYGYGYTQPIGYGYAARYDVPCVVETRGDKVIVNRPYAPGNQLTVLGQWITDPNTHRPLYRRDQGTLVVEQSNGITSLCSVARGYASRGDDIVVAPPPNAAGY